MKHKLIIFAIYFLCINTHAKIVFEDEKLLKHFKENNLSEIYQTTLKFKNVGKNTPKDDLELYKRVYLTAIYQYEKSQDYEKIYATTNDVLTSTAFNSDEKFREAITSKAFNSINANINNCQQNKEFILNIIRNGVLKNKSTHVEAYILTKAYINSNVESYKENSQCLSQFLKEFLNIESILILKNKDYGTENASKITKLFLTKTNLEVDNQDEIKNYVLINIFAENLITLKRKDEFISFIYEIHNQISPFLLEKTLLNAEEVVLDFKKNSSDFLFIKKFNIIGKYVSGEQWPFLKSKENVTKEILNYRSKDKITNDLMLVMFSKFALQIAKSEDKKSANDLYHRIISINTDKTAEKFGMDLKNAFELMISGFKITSAMSMGDIKTASVIHDEKINHLLDFFNSSQGINYLKSSLTNDQVVILIKPFLEYQMELGKKEDAKNLIKVAANSHGFDLSQLGDKEYLKRNKKKFENNIESLLSLLRDYYKFTQEDDELSKIETAIIILVPGSYNQSEDYFAGLFNAITYEDIDAGKFYLEIFKNNLRNFSEDTTYFLYLHIYDVFKNAFNAFPEESASIEIKNAWARNTREEIYDDYALMFFLENNKLGYFDKIFTLESLLVQSRALNKLDDYYIFSEIYLNLISDGVKSTSNESLSKSFKEKKLPVIENIILFYFENNYLLEAKNAISIFKQQSFFELLGNQGDQMRGLYSFNIEREKLISSKIKALNSNLALIDKRIANEKDEENIAKLRKLKTSLIKELSESNKASQNPTGNNDSNYKVNHIRDHHAYVDFFFKNGNLNILYQDKNVLKKISSQVDLKNFSNAIQGLYSDYVKNSNTYSSDSLNLIYKTLFGSIEELLVKSNIKTLSIRSNSFLTSIPIKHIISTRSDNLKDVSIIYQGVPNGNESKFNLDSRSALFATTQKFGNLPALNAANSEVNYIFDTYKNKFSSKNQSRKFVNKDFSIENFSSEFASQASVIHIASHFSANKNSGGLLLGTGQIVTPKEIWTQLASTKNSKLITISACESGLFNGQGQSIEDLPNVFLNKGATFVVATLWKISDNATADFMHIFYDLLMMSGDPASALNSTQTSFAVGNFTNLEEKYGVDEEFKRKHEPALRKYSSPYFWAGFQLVSSN